MILYIDIWEYHQDSIDGMFGNHQDGLSYTMASVQKQVGITECGLFALAFDVELLHNTGILISTLSTFQQNRLYPHLIIV